MKFWNHFLRSNTKTVCVSYPKSGRTWVRFALDAAGADVEFNHGGYATRDPKDLGYDFTGVRPKFLGARNIFLYRNALDTAVSEFYQIHNRIFVPTHPHFEQMQARLSALDLVPPAEVNAFVLHPIWGCRKVCAFNAAHIAHFAASGKNMTVRYEDLRRDPKTYFAAVLDFLQLRADIDRVVRESSFENMRALELNGDAETRKSHKLYGLNNDDVNTMKVRKGKVGGYVDVLTQETIAAARAISAGFGLELADKPIERH